MGSQKINVICLKWGTKYSASDVNYLYAMVQQYLTLPYKFYCYTDDSSGIIRDVNIIQMEDTSLEQWWGKLALFKKDRFKGINLFLDLDISIQNNIDSLIDHVDDSLKLIWSYWKEDEYELMKINSSVMLWRDNNASHVWEHFSRDPEYYMLKYHADDRFIFHENIKVSFFNKGLIYSRAHGEDKNSKYGIGFKTPIISDFAPYEYSYLYYVPDAKICLYNGPIEYKSWFKSTWLEYHQSSSAT